VLANLSHLVRGEYSMAPRGGSEIVRTVLSDEGLRQQWYEDLKHMSGRIKQMRQALYDELIRLGTPGTWNHVLEQVGLISW
jgi:aspartate aminotransferase